MITESVPLLRLMQGDKQFQMPAFHRRYVWRQEQVARYWQDLMACGEASAGYRHHVGQVITRQQGRSDPDDTSCVTVIDGQQRITTTTLLLLAVTRHIGPDGEVPRVIASAGPLTAARIEDSYLINRHCAEPALYFKLRPTDADWPTLQQLMTGGALPAAPNQAMVDALAYFTKQLHGADLRVLYCGLWRLSVIGMTLQECDHAQQIFDSVNATGLRLS